MPSSERMSQPRNPQLADALQTGDIAAVAFALRHGPTVVPLVESEDDSHIWTHLDPATGEIALLLFSDAAYMPAEVPDAVALLPAESLRAFLFAHRDAITTVFLDVAGPHPMQASPADLLAALEA